jgi:hypothetical protein
VFRWQKRAGNDIEGEERSFFFCPHCSTTVYYWTDPEQIAVLVGAFADRNIPHRASRCGRTACTRGSACPKESNTSAELLQALTAPAFSRPAGTSHDARLPRVAAGSETATHAAVTQVEDLRGTTGGQEITPE